MSDSAAAEELAVIRAAIAGEPASFERLVAHYGPRLRWLIELRLHPALLARVSADDVLQEVLIVVSERLGGLQIDREPAFWSWLCKVTEQRLIDVRRRHVAAAARDVRRERRLDRSRASASFGLADVLADTGTSPSGKLRAVEQREALADALNLLPSSYRQVIIHRVLEGLSVAETAEIMQRSPGAVSVVLTKAMKRLANVLRRDDTTGAPAS